MLIIYTCGRILKHVLRKRINSIDGLIPAQGWHENINDLYQRYNHDSMYDIFKRKYHDIFDIFKISTFSNYYLLTFLIHA